MIPRKWSVLAFFWFQLVYCIDGRNGTLTKEIEMASVSNKEVKVGDWVWFKADVEQCGKIVKIKGSMLILQASDNDDDEDTFDGDYIGGDSRTEVRASDCWLN